MQITPEMPPLYEYTAKDNMVFMKVYEEYLQFMERMLADFIGDEKRVLDFGAGDGEYANRLKNRGKEVSCVEIDSEYASLIRSKGMAVYPTVESTFPPYKRIYSCDVIEHIADERPALKSLHDALDKEGKILIYVPAFNVLFAPLDEIAGHYRRYTKPMLLPRMEEAGFIIEKAEYVDCCGFFAALLLKWFGDKSGSIDSGMIGFYYRYLFSISRLLDKLGGKYICGKNLMVIASRR